MPPEYSQQGHQEIKESGAIEETARAKTPEELEAEKAKLAAEAEQKRIAAEAQRKDNMLLSTFSTVEDIERVRDQNIESLEATISVTKARNVKIQEDLDKRIEAAANEERAGKEPNEQLLKDIESLKRQIANNEQFIDEKHKEQDAIRADYAGRIARFQELKGLGK